MFDKGSIKELLSENFPLLIILIGIVLVSITVGPYQNPDTQWEFDAVSGVLRWGIPYVNVFGNLMNQPPLGFYIEALFFKVFGSSIYPGAVLMTIFGLGCAILVYKIGKLLYGKLAGLVAAALFVLTPWALFLSRTFLIDVQCLFFSLSYLFLGILAIRKDSSRFFMFSGILFAAALLTKFYAVFSLIPLLLFYVYDKPKNLKLTISKLAAFFIPALLLVLVWYQVISGEGMLSVFNHGDFTYNNVGGVVPSYFFVGTFLINYGLGAFFIITAVFSLLICFLFRKLFPNLLNLDLIFLTTIVFVLGLNTFLGAGLNLKSPYNSAIKYVFHSLPFFSLLAGSLVAKGFQLFDQAKLNRKLNKIFFYSVILVGVVLLTASIFGSMYSVNQFSTQEYLLFRVEMDKELGYTLVNPAAIDKDSFLMNIQYLGFAFVLSGLLWASRNQVCASFKPMRRWIKTKNALSQTRQCTRKVFD